MVTNSTRNIINQTDKTINNIENLDSYNSRNEQTHVDISDEVRREMNNIINKSLSIASMAEKPIHKNDSDKAIRCFENKDREEQIEW